ncbi:hypothetical protein [Mycobacteroides abscessus]|uniref:hypothetical protein n=1 Tax=Mycobacteroides abscessus TaxID=36809 RepID=UPI000C2637BA|nr:hypothetical protein [Mycobacteroides abscessus]
MGRQLAVTDRTDLSFFKGWEGCYVEWQPATYIQVRKLLRADFANMTEEEAEKLVIELIKERTVGGKVKVVGDSGEPELVELKLEDIDNMPSEMTDRIYADMTGVQYDADPLEQTKTANESSADTDSTELRTPTTSTEKQ